MRIGKDSPRAKDVTLKFDAYKAGDQLQDKARGVDNKLRLPAGTIFGVQVE